jgi:RNA polymerase sigma-70 factor (ECF subfamily)
LNPEHIFQEYSPRIYRLALRMLGNETDAEDITQEVLLQVVRKLDTFRGDSSLGTWLHRVTTNAVLAHRRKQATLRECQSGISPEIPATESTDAGVNRRADCPEEQAQGRELSRLIEEATASLPEMYREVFLLSDVEGLTNAEVADLLGLSLSAVKSRLHRARHLLRDSLAPHL